MATQEPLVRFHELSGPKPWSPYNWCTRYVLNYKQIPYTVTKIPYPDIRAKCEELFGDLDAAGLESTSPIIEILQPPYKAINDSTPIAKLLNERFTEKDGFKHLKGIDELEEHQSSLKGKGGLGMPILIWILYDVYTNALDPNDGSKEYFKETREKRFGDLSTFGERNGGEQEALKLLRERWTLLQERMKKEDGTGDPTYIDFYEASLVQWIKASSPEKYEKLLNLWGDDTFTKLMKKVEKYEG